MSYYSGVTTGPARMTATTPRVGVEWPTGQVHQAIDGSIVFADLSGFTALSERLAALGREGAEAMAVQIDEVFGALLAGPCASQGDLLKFGGDAVALLFTGDAHPIVAVAAADEMRSTLRRVGRRDTAGGRVTIRISIGVHTGPLDLFVVGSDFTDLIVTGPAMSTVLALEGAATAGQVLVSPETAALVPQRWLDAPLGPGVLLRRLPPGRTGHGGVPHRAEPAGPVPALRRFLPPVIAAELGAGGGELEHRLVTVAFIQVVGLDDRLTTAGALAAAADLTATIAIIEDACRAYDVTFITSDVAPDGFKVVALTGAPRAGGDDEDRALRAARAIVRAGAPLPVRVGLHRGAAYVGLLHLGAHARYTAMGDTVNTAARVMAKAGAGQVLATPDVLIRSRTLFATTDIEPFVAKGKAKPIEAASVGAITGLRPAATERLPLVGREPELATLLHAWDQATAGHGGTALIASEAGFGGSRLLVELGAVAEATGADVVRLRGDPYQTSSAHLLTCLLLTRMLGSANVADGEALLRHLEALDPSLLQWAPLIAGLVELVVPSTPQVDALAEQFRADRQTDAVASTILAAVEHTGRPLCICVDDATFADAASLSALDRIGADAAMGTARLLVAVAQRAADDTARGWRTTTDIQLGPLNAERAIVLARLARGDLGILPAEAAEIADRAAGNPALVVELARAPKDAPFPESVEAAVAARIDRLPPASRTLLRVCAVLGTSFSPELAIRVAAIEGVESDLDALDEFLVPAPPGLLAFARPVEREAAYAGLSFARRRRLHHSAADAIEADLTSGATTDATAATLAVHRHAAGDWADAYRWSALAAEHAQAAWQPSAAAASWQLAVNASKYMPDLDPGVRARNLFRLGHARLDSGDTAGAREVALRGRLAAPVGEARAGFEVLLADLEQRRSRFDLQLLAARRGLRSLGATPTGPTAMLLLGTMALAATMLGRPKVASEALDGLDTLATAAGDVASLARASALRQHTINATGSGDDTHALRAIALYRAAGNMLGEGVVTCNRGHALVNAGRIPEAVALFAAAVAALDAAGAVPSATIARFNLGTLLIQQGCFADALVHLEVALPVSVLSESIPPARLKAAIALAILRAGECDTANTLLEDLTSDEAHLVRCELHLMEGKHLSGDDRLLIKGSAGAAWLGALERLARQDVEGARRSLVDGVRLSGTWRVEGFFARVVSSALAGGESAGIASRIEAEELGIIQLPPLLEKRWAHLAPGTPLA